MTALGEPQMCACGRPLHYADPVLGEAIEAVVQQYGPLIRVVVAGRAWAAPRHYLALHGLRAADLPASGFVELPVTATSNGGAGE